MTAAYRLATNGVVRTADGAFIPNDTRNRDWQAYQTWLAVPNTADAALVPTLSEYKATTKAYVDVLAEGQRQALLPRPPGVVLTLLLRYQEADVCDADGSPTTGEYPLLDVDVSSGASSSLADAADDAIAERLALAGDLAAIEAVRIDARADIDGAASLAAVDAVLAAITWP